MGKPGKRQRRRPPSVAPQPRGAPAPKLAGEQRRRIIAGKLEPGDVAALRRFVLLTQARFAEALGISRRTLQNWEQDRTTPVGSGLALLRLAARHPRIMREHISAPR